MAESDPASNAEGNQASNAESKKAWRGEWTGFVVRSCKYLVLLLALLFVLYVVFDGYSFYVARRSIDSELESKKISSLEYLNVLALEEVKDHPAKGQLSLESIRVLEERLSRLKEEREKNKERLGDLDDVMSRYAVWTGALSGGLAESPVLDEMAYDIGLEGDKALATVKCDRFKEYYQAVEQKLIRADPARGKISEGLSMWQQINNLPLVYRQFLVNYFKQPPAAQTLFVTLALGALGALTLNVLRLSKVGWWAQYKDPLWGEIMVSPLLGALAAFGIYLIGSAGLLLTTDMRAAQSGVTPLSAFFIGLLGFVSGLLYDEAFGRVRRLGTQLFAERIDRPEGRPEDKSLADALKQGSATRVAELVLKYGIGTRLATQSEFTFLVPSDEAVGQKPLQFWLDLNNEATSSFEKWYRRHHSGKAITKKDVAAEVPDVSEKTLAVDDGTTFALTVDKDEFKIAGIRVIIPDLKWGNGIIHVLSGEVA